MEDALNHITREGVMLKLNAAGPVWKLSMFAEKVGQGLATDLARRQVVSWSYQPTICDDCKSTTGPNGPEILTFLASPTHHPDELYTKPVIKRTTMNIPI